MKIESVSSRLDVEVVSAEAQIFSGSADMLFVTGQIGELGIAPGHSPLLTSIKPGEVRIIQPEGKDEEIFYISGGMLEVQASTATILADTVVRAEDLDEAAAQEAKDKAEEALANKQSDREYAEIIAELSQSVAQLRVIRELRNKRG